MEGNSGRRKEVRGERLKIKKPPTSNYLPNLLIILLLLLGMVGGVFGDIKDDLDLITVSCENNVLDNNKIYSCEAAKSAYYKNNPSATSLWTYLPEDLVPKAREELKKLSKKAEATPTETKAAKEAEAKKKSEAKKKAKKINKLIDNCKPPKTCSDNDQTKIKNACTNNDNSFTSCGDIKIENKKLNYYTGQEKFAVKFTTPALTKEEKSKQTQDSQIQNFRKQIKDLNKEQIKQILANLDKKWTDNEKLAFILEGKDGKKFKIKDIDLDNLKTDTLIALAGTKIGKDKAITQLTDKINDMSPEEKIEVSKLDDDDLNTVIINSAKDNKNRAALIQGNTQLFFLMEENKMTKYLASDEGKKTIFTRGDVSKCIVNNCPAKAELIKTFNKRECESSTFGCLFADEINEREVLEIQFLEDISDLRNDRQTAQQLFDTCIATGTLQNKCINEVRASNRRIIHTTEGYKQEIRDLALKGISDGSHFNSIRGSCDQLGPDCTDAVQEKINSCDDDDACKKEGAIILAKVREGYKKTEVETNALYSIISAIANPDRDAMNAARIFGFEPNYANVPTLLREPFASQICSAKIDGYLDKTRNDANDQGGKGVTVYGCSDSSSYDYDTETSRYETTGDPNCANVVLDLRAQRTQITPDNKVAITYSLYLKAPNNNAIKYFTAISYTLKNGQTKKELLKKPSLNWTSIEKGGVKTEYSTINFPLNISKENIKDTEKSFSISILAQDESGNTYQHKTTEIVLIGRSNSYVGISNDGTSSAGISSSGTPAITSNDMLALLN